MKRCLLLYNLVLFSCLYSSAQKIQYSRQTFKMPYADAIQLVGNVSGNHHVICFNANKFPVAYIYDAQLHLRNRVEIDCKPKETSDIRVLPFKSFYLLYLHTIGTAHHELLKIDGDGTVVSLSKPFQLLVEKELHNSVSTLQLVNQDERLFVIVHTYYDDIKKIASNILELDKDANLVLSRKVFYSFNKAEDALQQTTLAGNNLLVLKTSRNDERGNSLDLIKVDLATGHILINGFNIGSHSYVSPAFIFNRADSTILLHSIVREPFNSLRTQRNVFLCRLNDSLQEATPVTLLQAQFRNNITINYLLLQGSRSWLNLTGMVRLGRNLRTPSFNNDIGIEDASTLSLNRFNNMPSTYFTDQAAGVRVTVLNERFKIITDSLVANNQRVIDIQPRPFAQFAGKRKTYLILIQNFTADKRGLIMFSKNSQGDLLAEDISVVDKYQYLLAQSNAIGNSYFIMPYTHKNEIGLVKITPE